MIVAPRSGKILRSRQKSSKPSAHLHNRNDIAILSLATEADQVLKQRCDAGKQKMAAQDWGFTLENNSASFFHKSLSEISSATAWCLTNARERTNPT
jgi:hypothetical protein